jgi:hypothetical protein
VTLPFDSGDRKILLFAVCLFVLVPLLALLAQSGSEESSRGFPSSYSTGNDGAKAAYTLLEETGYCVERWSESPEDLPSASPHTLLIIAGPDLPASAEERSQLLLFVSSGGRLLLTGELSASLIGVDDVEPTRETPEQWQTFTAEVPAPLTLHAPEIQMEGTVRWVHPMPGQHRYYGDSGGATVTSFPMGKGEVIWWAGDSPLTNFGIARASNLALFLNSVGPPGTNRILWDEYFHGARLGLWSYVARSPLPWALLQVLLLAAFVLFTFARRSGAVRPIAREPRHSPLEFVVTLGALYERRRQSAGALEIAFTRFRFLLARRLGVGPTMTIPDLVRSAQAKQGWIVPGFVETMEQIDTALKHAAVNESKALAWIGELHDFAARLGLNPGIGTGR